MGYLVSTRGRYALRAMLDMAAQGGDAAIPLKDIAKRQEISQKYLESIMPSLKDAGLVSSVAGKSGGYRLSRHADEYTVGEILRASEGQLATVTCLNGGFECPRAGICKTLPMWKKLDVMVNDYLDTVKLVDLLRYPSGVSLEPVHHRFTGRADDDGRPAEHLLPGAVDVYHHPVHLLLQTDIVGTRFHRPRGGDPPCFGQRELHGIVDT